MEDLIALIVIAIVFILKASGPRSKGSAAPQRNPRPVATPMGGSRPSQAGAEDVSGAGSAARSEAKAVPGAERPLRAEARAQQQVQAETAAADSIRPGGGVAEAGTLEDLGQRGKRAAATRQSGISDKSDGAATSNGGFFPEEENMIIYSEILSPCWKKY